MARIEEYWQQVSSSDKFQDLPDDQKEMVRSKLYDRYVAASPSYQNLSEDQRFQIRQSFNDRAKILPSSVLDKGLRTAGKVIDQAKPVVKAAADIARELPKGQAIGDALTEISPVKKGVDWFKGKIAETENIIEPSEEKMVKEYQTSGELSNFSKARLFASGALHTVDHFVAGSIPTSRLQVGEFLLADSLLKYAGTTFLGKPRHLPGWKAPASGPVPIDGLAGEFKKLVLREVVEDNLRQTKAGPVKPLEVLARKEAEVETAEHLKQYDEWLKSHDALSPSGGEPQGDLHPETKANISQIRDNIKDRLEKLQKEPVHLESLRESEDALYGYFRNKVSQFPRPGEAVLLPESSVPAPPKPAMLPGGPDRPLLSGPDLNQAPEPAKPAAAPTDAPLPKEHAPTPAPTPEPSAASQETLANLKGKALKQKVSQGLAERLPGQSKQTVDRLSGALIQSLKDGGWLQSREDPQVLQQLDTFLQRILDVTVEDHLNTQKAKRVGLSSVEKERLSAKGIDPAGVEAEAKKLYTERAAGRESPLEDAIKELGGIKGYKPGESGVRPEAEEFKNVPIHLRGRFPIDEMVQMLVDEGHLPQGSQSSDLYKLLSERQGKGERLSVSSFYDQAIRNLERDSMKEVTGYFEEQAASEKKPYTRVDLPGTPAASMPPTALQSAGEQVPHENLMADFSPQVDNQNRDLFDILGEMNDDLGQKGAIGPSGEIDPVKKARMDENVKELVRRAKAMGYQTSEDIMVYAARNAPKDVQETLRKSISTKTVSPWDPHVYKEFEAAKNGSPEAKQSIFQRAFREYRQWKTARAKSYKITNFKDGDEFMETMKSRFFIRDATRGLSKAEREAMRFFLEGKTPDPDKFKWDKADEILNLAKNPTEGMKKAAAMIRPREDAAFAMLHEFYDRMNYTENYVYRRWKKAEQYMSWHDRATGYATPFTKHRKLMSTAEGINAGFEPTSLDIADDLRAVDDMRIRTLSRLHSLRKIALSLDDQGRPSLVIDKKLGEPPIARKANVTPHVMHAPDDWIRYDHPLLKGLAFNPDYKPAVDYMIKGRSHSFPVRMIEGLNALSKRSMFLYSLFHPWALTEMLVGGSSIRDLTVFNRNQNVIYRTFSGISKGATSELDQPLEWKNPVKSARALYDSFMKGHATLSNRPLALDAAEHTLRMSAIDDVQRDAVHGALSRFEDILNRSAATRPAGKAVKVLRGANDIFDKALWDYWHPMIKMVLYEKHLQDNMATFGEKMSTEEIKQQTASFVNKAVGGLAWGALLATPQAQQALQWVMMAPDWTIGRVLMGTAALKSGPEGRQARKLLARGAVTFFVFGNIINQINSHKYLGKGRYMWQNDPGRETDLVWGKDKSGRTIYLTPSKAFTELYSDIFYPLRTLRHKVSPAINAAVGAMNWMGGDQTLHAKNPAEIAKDMFLPMGSRGGNVYATFPKHKGMSSFEAIKLLEKYYDSGNKKFMDQAVQYGIENHLDVEALDSIAREHHSAKRKREIRDTLLR